MIVELDQRKPTCGKFIIRGNGSSKNKVDVGLRVESV